MHLNKDIDLHVMTRLIERPCTVGRPSKSRKPIRAAIHVADEPVVTIHEAAKWIGSRLSCKMSADGRVYDAGTIHAVYEGRDRNREQTIIYKVAYYPPAIFEEFTHNRMLQGIALYKEFERRKEASKNKEGLIHFD